VRLYLSSFGIGNRPDELVGLLQGKRRVGVILNAKDNSSAESRAKSLTEEIAAMTDLGLDATELDLRTYFGHQGRLREKLAELDMLWVRGGNVFVLRRALRQSGADEILTELLQNDAIVYAGYSAAVCALAPTLRGYELVDPPTNVPEGYDAETVWEGLGLLDYSVAPHYRSDHPESEAVEGLVKHYVDNHILFRALRDGEAIVIDGDRHEVVG